jgi:hypothetical protein
MKIILTFARTHGPECPFGHVLPPWWPRITLGWAADGLRRYEVQACLRHTRAAHRYLDGRASWRAS